VYKTFNRGSFREKVSFWFRCIDVTTSYEQVLDLGGNVLSVKQDAIKFNVNSTDYEATSLTIVNDRWYHIFIDIVRGNVAPYSFTIYLDDVQIKSETLTTTLNSFSDRIIFGGGLQGYIGTPLFSALETNQDRTELYNYGPPDEVLAVGGSATIAGKLGVGVINPTYKLDVNGDINLTGNIYVNGNNPIPVLTTRAPSFTYSTDRVSRQIQFIVDTDSDGWWDGTNYYYKPQKSGYYQFNWSIIFSFSTTNGINEVFTGLEKNGIWHIWGTNYETATTHYCCSNGSALVYMNGTTDYITVVIYKDTGGNLTVNPNPTSFPSRFDGFFVRK
jgi:hypothetical protein